MSDDDSGGAEARLSLWSALADVEDWLSDVDPASGWGGVRLGRELPELEAFAAAAFAGGAKHGSAGDGGARDDSASDAPSPQAMEMPPSAIDLAADAAAVAVCAKCRLGASRKNVAYGEGALTPLVLVIGEGPGAEEDAQGRPFVGPAGKLLDRMLASVGLSRETNCYIANVVKCRPPGNRDPAPDEKVACLPWLERQIEALRPRVILVLGRVAAGTLLHSEDGIGRLRGRWFELGGVPLISTYHPSALLRDESLKRPAWEDLKALKFRLDDIGSGR